MKKQHLYLAGAAIVAAVLVLPRLARQAGIAAVRPLSDGVWNVWDALRPKQPGVEFTEAGFYLDGRYVQSNGFINPQWRQAIEQAHPGNAALFRKITDSQGFLLDSYRHKIGGIVNG